MIKKVDHSLLGDVVVSHIFSNIINFEAVFGHPGFNISYVTPAFNLKTLLKNCSGLCELSIVVVGRCMYICMYLLFNFVANKEY